jgi:hypothetical protein
MMRTKHVLVVTNVTAMSDELLAALEARAAEESAAFTLIDALRTSSRQRGTPALVLKQALGG